MSPSSAKKKRSLKLKMRGPFFVEPTDFGNPTIVVCHSWADVGPTGAAPYIPPPAAAIVECVSGIPLRVMGSGFQSGQAILITICEQNTQLGTGTANGCGAFVIDVDLPFKLPVRATISVKAWVHPSAHGMENALVWILKAVWPLYIAGHNK